MNAENRKVIEGFVILCRPEHAKHMRRLLLTADRLDRSYRKLVALVEPSMSRSKRKAEYARARRTVERNGEKFAIDVQPILNLALRSSD